MQKSKWLSEEALEIAVKRREVKSKGDTKSSLDAAVHLRGLDPRKSVPPGRTCIQHVLLFTTAGARKQPNSSHGRVEAGDVLHTFMGCD